MHKSIQRGLRPRNKGKMVESCRIGVSQRILPIKRNLNSTVQCRKQAADRNTLPLHAIQDTAVRHHLHKTEPATEGGIEQSDGAILRIHSAQQIDIVRDSKCFVRIGRFGLRFFALSQTLGWLNQSNKVSKNFRDIAAVNFVNDKSIGAFRWGCT